MKVRLSLLNQNIEDIEFNQLFKNHEQTFIYFYPEDDTPWCTIEAKDFSENYVIFRKYNIWVYGISKDSDHSHCNFITKHGLSIPLISDPELLLHKQYNALWERNLDGKKITWTIRSTFLLDKKWNIIKERKNVKAETHVHNIISVLWLK